MSSETSDSTRNQVQSDLQTGRGTPQRETFSTDTARQMYENERAFQEKQRQGNN